LAVEVKNVLLYHFLVNLIYISVHTWCGNVTENQNMPHLDTVWMHWYVIRKHVSYLVKLGLLSILGEW